jgi:hypothetical protein
LYAIQRAKRGANTILNFISQWTACNRQHHREADYTTLNLDIAHHSEVDNRTVEFGVLYGAKGFNDLICCGG